MDGFHQEDFARAAPARVDLERRPQPAGRDPEPQNHVPDRRGLPQPTLQILVYPAVDDSFARPSWTEFADAPLMGTADAQGFRRQYVGDDGVAPSSLLTPLQAPALAGLAAAHVITAEVDCLRDDAEAYARRLKATRVSWNAGE
ncbi:alpha/beta hydrolase fold domain-containing protein [Streptomyces sp. NPDC101227]|uniref:alpha/beta hydrolase fold domain-containing protein n=1 Tax=Streptomyces sp. NPDC101227 TaxID=3366136 RepID=UPI0038009B03